MKKIALFLSIVVAAVACEQAEVVTPPEVDFANPDVVIPFQGSEDAPVTINFNANVDWTAQLDNTYDWISIAPASGKAGDAAIEVIASENESEDQRTAVVIVKAGVTVLSFDIVQNGVPYLSSTSENLLIPVGGGSVKVAVNANVEFACNITENDWLTYEYDEENAEYTFSALENKDFAGRSVSVTLSNNVSNVSTSFEVKQNGVANLEYNVFLDVAESIGAVSNLRLAIKDDHLLVLTGAAIHSFNKNTGAYEQQIQIPSGVVVNSLVSDDAGNILFSTDTNCPAGPVEIYAVSSLDQMSSPKKIISYVPSAFWAGAVGNIRVKGDINGDALVTATIGTVNYLLYWEFKGGVLQETASNWCGFGGSAINGPYNGCAAPVSADKNDGFLFIGYDGRYNLMHTGNLTDWTSLYDDTSAGANDCSGNNYASIATVKHNNKTYCAFERTTHWWTVAGGATVLVDITDPANPIHIYNNVSTYYSEGGIYGDVILESADGKLNMYVVDSQWAMLEKVTIAL